MRCLFVGIVFLTCNCVIWGQDVVFPTDEEIPHVSGDNSTIIHDRIFENTADCPKDMQLYPGDGFGNSVCDCKPQFLYFSLNDSCYEAYKRGPCSPGYYFVLPKNESIPHCAENPCGVEDGVVPFNGTCFALKTRGGPCAPDGVISVNETTFQLECASTDVGPFIIITLDPGKRPSSKCPRGSRRNAFGICVKLKEKNEGSDL